MLQINDNLERPRGWRARLMLARNRVLASPGFQRWAARLPLMRGIARGRARQQFDLIAGFVYAQVLAAFVEADLIEHIGLGARSTRAVALHARMTPESAERLLKAGAALGLVESPAPDQWVLGPQGAPMLANPDALEMVRHHRAFYADMADPLALLRGEAGETELRRFWDYRGMAGEGRDPAYSRLMAATQRMVSAEATRAYPFARHRRMLDVGGGMGAFATAVGRAAPHLALGILDLPPVIEQAREALGGDADLVARTRLYPASFKTGPIPTDYDLVTLVRICHDHDDDVVRALFLRLARSMTRGATLLIVEPLAGTRAAPAMGDAYFGFYLLAMGQGRPRTAREYRAMLDDAGFGPVREHRTDQPLVTRVLSARRR